MKIKKILKCVLSFALILCMILGSITLTDAETVTTESTDFEFNFKLDIEYKTEGSKTYISKATHTLQATEGFPVRIIGTTGGEPPVWETESLVTQVFNETETGQIVKEQPFKVLGYISDEYPADLVGCIFYSYPIAQKPQDYTCIVAIGTDYDHLTVVAKKENEMPRGPSPAREIDYTFTVKSSHDSHYSPVVNSVQASEPGPSASVISTTTDLGTAGDAVVSLNDTFDEKIGLNAGSGYSNTQLNLTNNGGSGRSPDALLTTSSSTPFPMNSGGRYTGIGSSIVTQTITDYDGDATTFNRRITVTTDNAPDLAVTYGSGAVDASGNSIAGTSFNTGGDNPLTNGIEGWSNQPLNVGVSSALSGEYYTLLSDSASGMSFGGSQAAAVNKVYNTQNTWNVRGVLVDAAKAIELSAAASDTIKIDLTAPTAAAEYDDETGALTDKSTDTLSGINSAMTQAAVVKTGKSPSAADYVDIADWTNSPSYTGAGKYDIYVKAYDKAGNSAAAKAVSGLLLTSSITPDIAGQIASGSNAGTVAASDTWVNGDGVKVTVSEPTPAETSNHYNVLYRDNGSSAAAQEAKGGSYFAEASKIYNTETSDSGITLYGVMEDDSGDAISNHSSSYVVKVDTTKPTAKAKITAAADTNKYILSDDGSADNVSHSKGYAGSGLNAGSLAFAFVKTGEAAPDNYADYTYGVNGGKAQDLSALGAGTYDVYAVVKDNAGNVSGAYQAATGITIVSDKAPVLAGYKADETDIPLTSGQWSNKDVKIIVKDPTPAEIKEHYNALFQAADSARLAVALTDGAAVTYTHSAETAGTDVYGVMLDSALPSANELSAQTGSFTIKIDKTNPTAKGKVTVKSDGTYTFADDGSNDNGSVQSGIDTTNNTIQFALALDGDTPDWTGTTFSAGNHDFKTSGLNKGKYNVYVKVWDNAANTAVAAATGDQVVVKSADGAIKASDFAYGMNQGELQADTAKFLSAVTAEDADENEIPVSDITVDADELKVINDAVAAGDKSGNPFDLTFISTTGKTVKVKVTLKDQSNPPVAGKAYITGNNFSYGINNGELDESIAKVLAEIAASDHSGVSIDLADITADAEELAAINTAITAGSYATLPLTFAEPDGESVTVSVTLYGNGPQPPVVKEEAIYGNNFSYGISGGAMNAEMAKLLSRVYAHDAGGNKIADSALSVDAAELAIINAAVAAGNKSGNPFDLTFESPNGKTVTVKVTLKDRSNPPAAGKAYITGNDFSYGGNNGELGEDTVKALAEIAAVDHNGVSIALADIKADEDELAVINAAIKAGNHMTLPLTFTEPGKESVTVSVTLYGNGPQPPVVQEEAIYGNNFSYGISSKTMSADTAKFLSRVYAHDADGNEIAGDGISADAAELAIINAAVAAGNKSGNPFDLTFESPNGKTVTVKVTLKDQSNPPAAGKAHITGNNFRYGGSNGELGENAAKELAEIAAVDHNGTSIALADIEVDKDELAAINAAITAGTYTTLPLTFTEPGGESVTVTVTLYGNGSQPPKAGEEAIYGNNFSYGISSGAMSADIAKMLSRVYAHDAGGEQIALGSISVNEDDLAAINAAIAAGDKSGNPFDLTFESPNSKTVTVKVTLKDQSNPPAAGKAHITGNNFSYGMNNGELGESLARELAEIAAMDAGGVGIALTDIKANEDELAAINAAIAAGAYTTRPLTFTEPGGESVTVTVTLYGNGSQPPKAGEEAIYGNNFGYGISSGAMSADIAKMLSHIYAHDAGGNPIAVSSISVNEDDLAVINAAIAAGDKSGNPFNLAFESPNGKTVTVKVTLKDQSNPPTAGKAHITGNDFSYGINNGELGENLARELAEIAAVNADGISIAPANISADQDGLAAINAAIEAGTYTTLPLTFTEPGGERVTVSVTLYENGSQPPKAGEEAIYANNFNYGISSGAMSADTAKILSHVYAHDAGGNPIADSSISVDENDLAFINAAIEAKDKSGNPFDLTFESPNGKTVTVKVNLKDHSNQPEAGKAYITGNNFKYGINNGELGESLARELAEIAAVGTDGIGIALAGIKADEDELAAINAAIAAGTYTTLPLTFTEPGGECVTVSVTLYGNGPEPPEAGEEAIYGNNFSYGISSGIISADTAKLLAAVYAHDAAHNAINTSTISVDAAELAVINLSIVASDKSGNPFDLTFSTKKGKSVTVKVTLKDEGTTEPPAEGKEYITGNDFKFGLGQGNLTEANAKFLAQIDARNADASKIALSDVTVDTAGLDVINAAITAGDKSGNPFDLTFYTPDGTSVTVQVTLYDRGNPDPQPGKAQISANDFNYGINQGSLDTEGAKIYAGVNAYDADGNQAALSEITVDEDELKVLNDAIEAKDKSGNPFDLTFKTTDGSAVTIQVTLKDYGAGVIDPDDSDNNTDRISGNDFAYGTNQPALTGETAKEFAGITAVDKDGNPISIHDITVDENELKTINDAVASGDKGDYSLTFTTPDGTTLTVTVTIKSNGSGSVDPADPSNNTERITANDFLYGINEGALSEAAAKYRSQAVAADKNGEPIALSNITTNADELAAINAAIAAGISKDYPLTYSTLDGTSVTVTVTLKNYAVEPDEDVHDTNKTVSGNIGANDFIFGINEAGLLTAEEAKLRARVEARDMFGNDYKLADIVVDAGELAALNAAKTAKKTGTFPLTYTSPEGKSVTVQVTILDKVAPPVIDPADPSKNESTIGASDFNYGRDQGKLTADKAKELAKVAAKDKNGSNLSMDQITAGQAQLDAINDAIANGSYGTYPLTFTEPGGKQVSIEVKIWDHVISNPDSQQEMTGNDFDYDLTDGELTADKAKELAEITAQDENGNEIPLDQIHVGQDELDKLNDAIKNGVTGEYELTFTTGDGQELVVTIDLYDGTEPNRVEIRKVDESGKPLTGAALALYDAAGNELYTWASTAENYVLDNTLTAGAVYTLKELAAPNGYLLATDVTFTAPAPGKTLNVTMTDKKVSASYHVEVAKLVKFNDEYRSTNYSFYAALFWDEAHTQRASEVLELKLESSYVTTGVFKKLAAGTYYLAETDKEGNALNMAEQFFSNEITGGVINLTENAPIGKAVITNIIETPPGGFLLEDNGEIQINKSVSVNGEAYDVTDTFYFTLYSDEMMENSISTSKLSLSKASAGSVSFKDMAYGSYYIAESDEAGKPVGDGFKYDVSISDTVVTLNDANKVSVDIINTPNDIDGSEEESEDETDSSTSTGTTSTKTTKSGTTGAGGTTGNSATILSTGAKTGDVTNQSMWFALAGMALMNLIIVVSRRKKER